MPDDICFKVIEQLHKKYVTTQNPLYLEIRNNGDLEARVQIYRDWMSIDTIYNEIIQKLKEIGTPQQSINFMLELTILLMAFSPEKYKKEKITINK